MLSFADKVAVITGAGGDIGRATAVTLAKQGATIVALELEKNMVDKVVSAVREVGGTVEGMTVDVTDGEQLIQTADAVREKFERVDLLVNNAGIEGPGAPITELDDDSFDAVFAVNVKGPFLGLKYFAPLMPKDSAVVNLASVAGINGSPGMSPYVSSKHAVIGLTKTAALEFAEQGIRVNAVCPAPISGRMMESIEGNLGAEQESFKQMIPLNRYGTPQEVANLIVMLLSDEASYLTGGVYTVDGGLTAG
jgi:3alpha(or 20beta)-hydroxysteroid dehydrogenase